MTNSFRKTSRLSKILSFSLVAGSLVWLGWIIWRDIHSNWATILPDSYMWLLIALIIGIISQFHNVFIFSYFLRLGDIKNNFPQVAKLFFTGQIIRYIPGRIWGIYYQVVNSPSNIPSCNIILANIELMFVAFSGILIIPTSIILFHFGIYYLSVIVLLGGFSLIVLVLLKGWTSNLFSILKKILKRNNSSDVAQNTPPLNTKQVFYILGISLFSWLVYLLGWVAIGKAGYGSIPSLMIILAAMYSFAWFIGYLSMITPSGIGIRETSFLLLSHNLVPPAELAILAIVVRIWLLLIDLSLFSIFFKIQTNKELT